MATDAIITSEGWIAAAITALAAVRGVAQWVRRREQAAPPESLGVVKTAITRLGQYKEKQLESATRITERQLDLEALRTALNGAPPGGSFEFRRPGGVTFSFHANPHDPRARH